VTNPLAVLPVIERELLARQLPSGGWSFFQSSAQAALEPTCLSLLALRSSQSPLVTRARNFVLRIQNPNGSWPAFVDDDGDGAWVTSLAVMALQDFSEATSLRLSGLSWLLHSAGRESNWFWKWKFRTTDLHVRFNPDKFGWPWMPGTTSWVIPTAFAILAITESPCTCGLEGVDYRLQRGREMLLDRACPGGGWNAGNGVVYGFPLVPHPDATAIALLAFLLETSSSIVRQSLQWLQEIVPILSAPWSLAWATLALAAHQYPLASCVDKLALFSDIQHIEDTATVAALHLAFSAVGGMNPFGRTQ
jgi:hypothetical protein